jgi:Sensors of blue-light using FAD
MISLLYVSRAVFPAGSEDRQLIEILHAARVRNPEIEVTGALIHLGGFFAQILEGESAAVNQLMIDILRDRRHTDVRIIEVVPIQQRRFGQWAMAWVPASPGPKSFIEILTRADSDVQTAAAAAALVDYMARFADSEGGA